MTRTMFDGITPGSVPAGAQLYAAYLDGNWADFAALVAKFPAAIGVPISVSASYNGGIVLDVETGDATPTEAVVWVLMRRAAGVDPTVYCNTSTWPEVRTAFEVHDVPEPHYWVANYSFGSNPAIPAGAVALQYADKGGYDVSVVADYWPGVDPVPSTQGVTMTPAQETTLLEQVGNLYAATFLGGPSMNPAAPGEPGNSIVDTLTYLVTQAGKPPVAVDAAAVAAALVPLLPTVKQIAAAVAELIGTDLTPKAP
jgi:hypothetical protein